MIEPVYSTQTVFDKTYELTKQVNVEGDIVECGLGAGSNFAQMIKACLDKKETRNYWGFDSFDGIPYGIDKDILQPGQGYIQPEMAGKLVSTGVSAHSLEDVTANLKRWEVLNDNVHLVKGWFQDTVHLNTIDKIAVLRLDGDLYESTKVCLEHLYKKVVKGGLVIIDDWTLSGCNLACKEFFKNKKVELIEFEYTAYLWKP